MRGNGNGSTRRPHEIQAEIERTRNEMDGTLSAIEQRLTPGQLFDQGVQYLRNSGGSDFLSNLGEQAKQNPMPVALVGVGLAWLMATGRVNSTNRNSGTAKVADTAASVRDKAVQVRDTAQAQVARAKGSLDTMMAEQPLAIGAIGLALGALAAALAPRTQQEERIASKIDSVADPETDSPDTDTARDGMTEERWRLEQREQKTQGVKPYAERGQSEPPV